MPTQRSAGHPGPPLPPAAAPLAARLATGARLGTLLALFTVAAALRLGSLYSTSVVQNLEFPSHLVAISPFLNADAPEYAKEASRLRTTGSLGLPFFPPFTAAFVAALQAAGALLGLPALAGAKLAYSLLAALVPVLTARLGARLISWRVGWVAGLLCALSFTQIPLALTIGAELPYSLLLLGFLLGIAALREGGGTGVALATGMLAAAAILTRTEFLVMYLLASLWCLGGSRPQRARKAARVLLMTAPLAIGLLAWSWRNYRFMTEDPSVRELDLPRFVPTAMNGPVNFYIGNSPLATGRFSRAPVGSVHLASLTDPAYQRLLRDGYRLGWEWIRADPGRWAELELRKVAAFWDVLRLGYGRSNLGAGLEGIMPLGEPILPRSSALLWLHGAALAGGFLRLQMLGRGKTSLLLLVLCGQTGVMAAFFGMTRAALPFWPLLALLMAGLADGPRQDALELRRPWLAAVVVLLSGTAVLAIDVIAYGPRLAIRQLPAGDEEQSYRITVVRRE